METIRAGLQESVNGLKAQHQSHHKPQDAVSVSVNPVTADSASDKTVSIKDESLAVSKTRTSTSTSTISLTRVVETSKFIRGNICKFGDYNEHYFKTMNLESYLEYISDERLIHMPRRGSDWDRVLRTAQFFGLQLWAFGSDIGQFTSGTESASITALGSTQILLKIGPNQAQALVPTFQALYELTLLISHVSQIHEVFTSAREVKELLAHLYCDIVELVGNISIFYKQKIGNLGSNESVTINFEAAFGGSMTHIWERRDQLTAKLWSLNLGYGSSGKSLDSIRRRLRSDRSTKGAFYDQVNESMKRAEDTCEWLKSHLVEFYRGNSKALTITGDAGCGKTILAGWIKERLQRPLDHVQYRTLSYTFPFDAPSQCTQLSFLKSILFQLLENNVGDVNLFAKLESAYEEYDKHQSTSKLEISLWAALEAGLRTLNDRQIHLSIIVDGFHEITGDITPLDFHKALRQCVGKFKTIRVITLSKPISHLSDGCHHFTITPQHLQADLKAYFRQSLHKIPHFCQLGFTDRERIVGELATKAKASFLWAYVVLRLLTKEAGSMTSAEAFHKAAHGISGSLDDMLKQLVSKLSLKEEHIQSMLCFMLASTKPLAVGEMAELLRVNVKTRQFGPEVNVPKHVASHCSDIVVIEHGSLHFKSKAFRTYMQSLMGKSLHSAKDAHRHLTSALLLYAKLTLSYTSDSDPTFEPLSDKDVDELFHSHALLYYAVRHWRTHFCASSYYGAKGELVLTKEFHEIFPGSCHFALLERAGCGYGVPATKLLEHHQFSLKIREACFGEKHISVLQTLIILGDIHVSVSGTIDGAKCFYRAACLGKLVLSQFSTVVVACTSYFLQYTETITITTRTEIVTCREEMILFYIEICKRKHGPHSDVVIRWYECLAKLYVDIKEEHRATLIYKVLYEIYVIVDGKQSPRARRICDYLGGLEIVLKGETKQTDIEEYAGFFLETTEELDVADERRVSILLRLAIFYESQKQWYLAERIYITLWRRISEICRIKATLELHITKITIACEYVRFLHRHKRTEEACNILICLWVEYEHHGFDDKTIIIRIKEMGVLFRTCGMLSVAISVFTKVWGWFKSKGKTTDEECTETTVLITEVVEEITETTVTTKTTTITTTEVTETITREIFETHLHRCKKSKVDTNFFNSCLALVNLYIKMENWAQAEIVIKQSLEITWKAILTAETTITLHEHFSSECIAIATRLAVCYHRQCLFEKAESIYLRIFHACLHSLHIEDCRIEESLAVLVRFYEEHHRHEKVIQVYVELLARYKKTLGHSHRLTIKTLYILAGHCRLLGRSDAYKYYIEIVTVLNQNHKCCHRDAFEAAIILVKHYHETRCWKELQHICGVLWETFVHHHKEHTFTEEIVTLIYEKYVYVLEFHAKVELSVLYEISVKYKETVTIVFGASASIVILAMIALAGICERHEKHHHECVTLYEEVIKRTTTTKTTTTTVTETTISTVKKRLSKVYVTIITNGKTTTTTTTVERALVLCLEAYMQLKVEFGCWHEKTLLKLKDVVIIYQKLGGKECHAKIVALLQVAFIDIATTTTCGSMALYQAAKTIASIYILAGLRQHGCKLVQQLRHMIIFGHGGNDFDVCLHADISIKLDTKSIIKRSAFVFLVSLEQHLVEKVIMSYSELMACTLLEITLYEEYKRVTTVETKIEIQLEYGAKLRAFWVEQHQHSLLSVLDKKLFALFKTKYASFISTHDDHTHIYYLSILESLGCHDHYGQTVDFALLACRAGNAKVASLLKAGEFKKALEVARCTFHFCHKQGFYASLQRVQYSYKLAEFMAGIDVPKPTDKTLWAEYLKLSKEITTEALAIFRAHNIDFVRLKFEDLSGIVRLLGSQQNYAELEVLLLKLWKSREVQKTWTAARVLSVGRLMVHAHVAANNIPAAIELCDTMCYNLRRSRGVLDPVTIEMSQMLAALYTSNQQVDRSMGVHEQILREIEASLREAERIKNGGRAVSVCYYPASTAKDASGTTVSPEELAKTASWQLELLKRAHFRLGGWTKPEGEFTALHERLVARLGKAGLSAPGPETWTKGKGKDGSKQDDMIGKYVGLRDFEWKLEGEAEDEGGHSHSNGASNGTVAKKKRWTGVDHVLVASQEWLVV
ncbi:hypothetical protein B0H66DRAFT_555192 [Apodospora peruviana]|uniref:Nephrocystin 3-like N-terminal domain-containing protein n=1 Tax=Apodospora peruviana TaxID=516989 RepID=A0AAE0IDJ0_9PEZI|nr:hypothetical protein B0H66DRAFT_555192 [Apodospora peruviana]